MTQANLRKIKAWVLGLGWRRDPDARQSAVSRHPAVPIEQSVTPNFLICLETGQKMITLRRHLINTLNLSPDEYRARWGLPSEYPMVAESYCSWRKSVQKRK